jgi:hypothetical protein
MVRVPCGVAAPAPVPLCVPRRQRHPRPLPCVCLQAELSHYAKQLGAFFTLVVVQAAAILLFKLCQQNGTYTFNPASSVALTEMCKLLLAFTLHAQYVQTSKKPFWENVTVSTARHPPRTHCCKVVCAVPPICLKSLGGRSPGSYCTISASPHSTRSTTSSPSTALSSQTLAPWRSGSRYAHMPMPPSAPGCVHGACRRQQRA